MKFICVFALVLSLIVGESFSQSNQKTEYGFRDLRISTDGNKIIYSHERDSGLFLTFINQNRTIRIAENYKSAYRASWSADGNYVVFKYLKKSRDIYLQIPCIYDVDHGKIIELAPPTLKSGTTSISNNGTIVFTIDKQLHITDLSGKTKKSFSLPSYANQTPISPDGQYVVFNDQDDNLWLLNLMSGKMIRLTFSETGYFNPEWSPDSKKIVASSLNGNLVIIDILSQSLIPIGEGRHPSWSFDGNNVIFSRAEILFNREVLNMDLFMVKSDGTGLHQLTFSEKWEDYPVFQGRNNNIFYSDLQNGNILNSKIVLKNNKFDINATESIPVKLFPNKHIIIDSIQNTFSIDKKNSVYFDIPYVNQRYDTPDWFNGNWACGATSAIMCITYYGLLEQWPVVVSSPWSHISDYGNYICEIYTYNGITYNIGGQDPNGTIGYGGYGFIIKNNWANTKEFMRQYAVNHGLISDEVDWSPSRLETMIEIDDDHPFVLLNSLTTAGHYISVIGYELDATTVIVNDPYGDKNLGYANFYGRRARYDWPGYNNGYQNLNTVWCFIYFQGDPPADLVSTNFSSSVDTAEVSQIIQVSADIYNNGKMPSVETTAAIVLSVDDVYDSFDEILKILNIPSLDTMETCIVDEQVTLPDSLISEIYRIGVFADVEALNKEMMKDNNFDSRNLVIHGYPRIYSILPDDSSFIAESRPEIRAKCQDVITKIDTANMKLFVDGLDVTDSCTIYTRKIKYNPGYDLSIGLHKVRVEIPNNHGLTAIQNWSFTIEQQSGISNESSQIPESIEIFQNYPNPFNSITKIRFGLPTAGKIKIDVYNSLGQKVAELLNENKLAGYHSLEFDGSNLASGVYYYRIQAVDPSISSPKKRGKQGQNFVQVKKMLLLK